MTDYNSILIEMEYQRIEEMNPYDYDCGREDDEPDKELVTVPPTKSNSLIEYDEF